MFQYLSDLTQLQPRDDDSEEKEEGGGKTFGTLHFSIAYLKGRSAVEVNVIQGVDLPALDSNGMLRCMVMKIFMYWHINSCHSMPTLPYTLDSLTPGCLLSSQGHRRVCEWEYSNIIMVILWSMTYCTPVCT